VVLKAKLLPTSKIFPFLDLPGEIRNMIYQECLVDYNRNTDDKVVQTLWLEGNQRSYLRVTRRMKPKSKDYRAFPTARRRTIYYRPSMQSGPADQTICKGKLAVGLLSVCKQVYQEVGCITLPLQCTLYID
jgi:hypothetical protein